MMFWRSASHHADGVTDPESKASDDVRCVLRGIAARSVTDDIPVCDFDGVRWMRLQPVNIATLKNNIISTKPNKGNTDCFRGE